MQTIGIRELQTNPAIFTKAMANHEFAMITKRSTPIGIAVAFDDGIVTQGLKTSLLIEGYKNGNLSLGQFCKAMEVSKESGMKILSLIGVDIIEYDFSDDLAGLESL